MKIRLGRAVEHKTEQRVVDAIRDMKDQGLGLRQIARNLSKLGISTKCNGVRWHPEMVKRILASNTSIDPAEVSL